MAESILELVQIVLNAGSRIQAKELLLEKVLPSSGVQGLDSLAPDEAKSHWQIYSSQFADFNSNSRFKIGDLLSLSLSLFLLDSAESALTIGYNPAVAELGIPELANH